MLGGRRHHIGRRGEFSTAEVSDNLARQSREAMEQTAAGKVCHIHVFKFELNFIAGLRYIATPLLYGGQNGIVSMQPVDK
jgi:hypothetical protein